MRVQMFVRILSTLLALLVAGLFYTQVVRHDVYKVMSEENRLRVIPLMAPRGSIFDKNGNAVVKDDISFDATVTYSQIKDKKSLIGLLSDISGLSRKEITVRIEESRGKPYSPVCIIPDIGTDAAIQFEEVVLDYPGLHIAVTTKRDYLYGRTASAVIGYIGPINRPEFEKLKHYGYKLNDMVGRGGVEEYYDNYLRGTSGGKQVEVDHLGREILTLGYLDPVPGKNIHMTIDLDLQKFCDGLLENKRGAIIVMDSENGAIRAMSSAPGYDPEVFIDRKRHVELEELLKDKKYPLMDRAISAAYPPGSVFKLVVAAAALDSGKATPGTSGICTGSIVVGKKTFHCWRQGGHGEQDLIGAIKNSCNVYFYRLGMLIGADKIADSARRFGFGELTGIDLPQEVRGTVPDSRWKKKLFKEKWYQGETVNYAIGQGYLLVTPIQVAKMISVFANRGSVVHPHIVRRIDDVEINCYDKVDIGLSPAVIDSVREGMKECVNDRHGTGMKARVPEMVISGKTGTAQTSTGKNHGWFGGFAPFDKAALTVVVFDEYGGRGGYYAAETAGMVFREAKRLGLL